MKRKIAAILAADIVGYSRLVGEDEEETLRRLENYRAVFSDFVARFGGRIFNTAGDAILAEFASAVDAVRCAVDTQESLRTRNLAYPASRQMNFRIGITIGDIVEREGDLLGEGVNIASRLEGIAPIGGICISRSVHEAVANKISLKFSDVGEQQLKNLPDRVHAYTVTLEQQADGKNQSRSLKAIASPVGLGAVLAGVVALAIGMYLWGAPRGEISSTQREHQASPTDQPKVSGDRPATSSQMASPVIEAPPDSKAKAVETINQLPLGQWAGAGADNEGNSYSVTISLLKAGKGTVSYPELKCSGTLEYILRRGEAHVFREKITKGSDCGLSAEVELRPGGHETLQYTWIGQGPKLTGTLAAVEAENCQKYLPNIGVMVPTRCDLGDDSSETTPPVAQDSIDIDPATLGTWILTVPRGRWVWVTRDDGTYEFHSEATDGAPPHSGRFDAKDGRWSLQSTGGFDYTDEGAYQILPSGIFLATGRLGAGAWKPANPVRRTHRVAN